MSEMTDLLIELADMRCDEDCCEQDVHQFVADTRTYYDLAAVRKLVVTSTDERVVSSACVVLGLLAESDDRATWEVLRLAEDFPADLVQWDAEWALYYLDPEGYALDELWDALLEVLRRVEAYVRTLPPKQMTLWESAGT